MVYIPLLASDWEPRGKHVLITGGSQGLGLALAKEVSKKGADVTIVARSVSKLEKAVEEVQAVRQSSKQRIAFFSADLTSFEGASQAVSWSSASPPQSSSSADHACSNVTVGRCPDAVFCCAGGSTPGWFLEQSQETFEAGFKTDYMTALGTAQAAAKVMTAHGVRGKIVFVSSTLGLMGLVGYTQYAPMKFAIRGLAETLRSELLLYSIDVHCYFPGTILSPGYEVENRTKPDLTKQLEGGPEEGLTPEQCAKGLLAGLSRGQFFITTDFQTELFRASTSTGGSVPGNIWLLDQLKALIGIIALPIWRKFTHDRTIRSYSRQHKLEVGKPRRMLDRLSSRPYGTLFMLSLCHRCLVLASLFALSTFTLPFDTSAQLQLDTHDGDAGRSFWRRLGSALVRWDTVHFLGAASPPGIEWEHTLAFQPGLIWLLKVAGFCNAARQWSSTGAVILTSLAGTVTGCLAPPLLFHVLCSALDDAHTAHFAALLSVFSPSPSTLVTPTPEPFFATAALLGISLLSPKLDSSNYTATAQTNCLRGIIAAGCFAIATAFRANGLLLIGYLWYGLLWDRPRSSSLLPRLAILPILSVVAASPFIYGQVWAYRTFCSSGDGSQQRDWCNAGLPSVYSYVQSEYWGVGFLRYWTLAQLPNFALAAPVLVTATLGALRYFRCGSASEILRHVLLGWYEPQGLGDVSAKQLDSFSTAHSPRLLPHLLLSVVNVCLLLFQSHVQIALRFASPAWIGLWVSAAELVASRRRQHHDRSSSLSGRLFVGWLCIWTPLSLVLFAAFLPPA